MIDFAFHSRIWLRFDDNSKEELAAYSLPGSRFRLAETPVLAVEPVYAGDIVGTELLTDGSYRFLRVLVPGPFCHYSRFLSHQVSVSDQLKAFLQSVESSGGDWEQVFGGLIHLHVPRESTLDVQVELMRVIEAVHAAPEEYVRMPVPGTRRTAHLKFL